MNNPNNNNRKLDFVLNRVPHKIKQVDILNYQLILKLVVIGVGIKQTSRRLGGVKEFFVQKQIRGKGRHEM
jgi:hypothetical protein